VYHLYYTIKERAVIEAVIITVGIHQPII